MTIDNQRCFYKRNYKGDVICIKYGESGYYETTIDNDEHLKFANRVFENTANEVEAAETCSMFNIWNKFDSIVAKLDMVDKVMHPTVN